MHYFPILLKILEELARLLAYQVEKLARLWQVGTFIGTLARKNEKSASFWHNGTWASGHVDHTGVHDTRFSKLFLIKLFFYMTKKSRQKSKYLANKDSF